MYGILFYALFLIYLASTEISAEPQCSKYDYEEKLLSKMIRMEIEFENLQKKLEDLPQSAPISSTYIRWGRTRCDGAGTELVYKGYAGGSMHTQKGGNTNYLCLPEYPEWSTYDDTPSSHGAQVYGAEYQFGDSHPTLFEDKKIATTWTINAPCAVCRASRDTTLMIPGKLTCPSGWKSEYSGYLVGGHHGHDSGHEFVCMDSEPEAVPGGDDNENGRLFYIAEARCGSLKCPPYVNGREITCVVCSI